MEEKIVEETPKEKSIQQELQEAAEAEGLVAEEEYLGGEGASPEEVIAAMRAEQMPEGARKNKIQYEDKKIEDFVQGSLF